MGEYTVYFTQTASAVARRVEAEDSEDAIEKAWDELPGSLCHQCAREIDLAGEWEPYVVEDESGNVVWQERHA